MSERIKNPHTENMAMVIWHGSHYALPLKVIEKYRVADRNKTHFSIGNIFSDLIDGHSEQGFLLKRLQHREGLSQINLSAMENGRRPIGK